jgi:hypothetical protein
VFSFLFQHPLPPDAVASMLTPCVDLSPTNFAAGENRAHASKDGSTARGYGRRLARSR